jgi:HlyD family secretion protein
VLENCPSIDRWHKDVPRSVRLPVCIGVATLIIWGAGFGLWAGYAPLDGAVVTPGTFVATGQNKLVQHLEGGIIREILVKEGELVEKHQVLVRLDETAVKARLARLVQRHNRLLAIQARLQAEMRGDDSMKVPVQLAASTDPEIAAIIDRQKDELAARKSRMDAEISVIIKEISSIEEGIQGHRAQVAASESQLKSFRAELADKEELLKRALVRRPEVLALQRADARTAGELGQLRSRIADAKERIARAHQQVSQIRSAAVQKSVEELRLSETELDDIREQINAAKAVAARVEVVAPVRGIVVKLHLNTTGGVINPGAVILELLPVNVDLIIESRVLPADIAQVKEGQAAQVRITALNSRMTPMVDANVVYVSADAVGETDPRKLAANPAAGHALFVVKVRLDEEDLRAKAHDFRPMPGMPADVFIKTGQRTFFQYLMKPLSDSFAHAFRER